MDVRLRVVDASVGFRTFFDSVSFRLLRDAAKVIQENHYYPFGQNMVGIEELDQQSLSSQEEQKFQYNAKEKLDEFGLFWNDHGARNLDLQTGRWTSVDPLAEKAPHYSPYVFCFNNSLIYVDPDGQFPKPWVIAIFEKRWGNANSIKFSNEIYAQMNKSWNQSFDKSNNSTERGATLTVNISKKTFEFVNIGGKASTSGTFKPDINIDDKKNVLIGTFHTHPYGENDGSLNGAFMSFSGGDFATMGDFDEAVSIVQSGKNVYVLAMTSKTPKNLDPASGFFNTQFQSEYAKQIKNGLSKKAAAEKANDFAVKKTAKEYKMMYFKGENGKALQKQTL